MDRKELIARLEAVAQLLENCQLREESDTVITAIYRIKDDDGRIFHVNEQLLNVRADRDALAAQLADR